MAGGYGLATDHPPRLTTEMMIVRTLLLTLVYYCFVTPVGLLSQVVGIPVRWWRERRGSYWIVRDSSDIARSSLDSARGAMPRGQRKFM
jgi:hypothetical protein